MSRKLFLSLLALLFIAPALAQVAPIRVIRPPGITQPVIPPVEPLTTAPSKAPVFDVANDPERARALINKLRKDKRLMREKMQTTLTELQNARTMIDEMTRLGGSLVRAQCVSATLSRTTSGIEENCAASGYACGGTEGTCHRSCSTSSQCSTGFVCDTGAARCVTPPPPADDDDDDWF
jgi:hypothetical protein